MTTGDHHDLITSCEPLRAIEDLTSLVVVKAKPYGHRLRRRP
jgi:hypothetical protein